MIKKADSFKQGFNKPNFASERVFLNSDTTLVKAKKSGLKALLEASWEKVLFVGEKSAKTGIARVIKEFDDHTSYLIGSDHLYPKPFLKWLGLAGSYISSRHNNLVAMTTFYKNPEKNFFIDFLVRNFTLISDEEAIFVHVKKNRKIIENASDYVNYVKGVSAYYEEKDLSKRTLSRLVFVTGDLETAKALEAYSEVANSKFSVIFLVNPNTAHSLRYSGKLDNWITLDIQLISASKMEDLAQCVKEIVDSKGNYEVEPDFVERTIKVLNERTEIEAQGLLLPLETYTDFILSLLYLTSFNEIDYNTLSKQWIDLQEEEILKALSPLISEKTRREEGIESLIEMMMSVNEEDSQGQQQNQVEIIKKPLSYSSIEDLRGHLLSKVIGQNLSIEKIVRSLMIPLSGINDPVKPLRSFLFAGPTGTGKTSTALALADSLFDRKIPLLRLDMSEFDKESETAKLFGAPQGYVGHGEGGILTNHMIKNPETIILLDEIEKAHPKIFDVFLQVLDAGRMTTPDGKEVDFSKSVVIMTTNVGAERTNKNTLGFTSNNEISKEEKNSQDTAETIKSLKNLFKLEFINRIDQIVVFDSLDTDSAIKIVEIELEKINNRLKARGNRASLKLKNVEVARRIVEKVDLKTYGARAIQRELDKIISEEVVEAILNTPSDKKISISIDFQESFKISYTRRKIKKEPVRKQVEKASKPPVSVTYKEVEETAEKPGELLKFEIKEEVELFDGFKRRVPTNLEIRTNPSVYFKAVQQALKETHLFDQYDRYF